MRRALIEERQLEALRERCAAIGARVIVEVDREGEASIQIGDHRCDEWFDAVTHVAGLEAAAGVDA